MIRSHIPNEPLALWASRLSLFALALVGLCFLLHRLGILGTPVAMTATGVAFAAAILGILIGLVAAISIWTRGRNGAGRVAVGLIGGATLCAWPLAALPTFMALPQINDVSTDTANPPRFAALAKDRPSGAKSPAYPGERAARLQSAAYPDLRTLVVDRSAEEVFEYARLSAAGRKGLGWKVVTLEPPTTRPPKPGLIEATTRTTIIGFTDDVVIRVSGSETESRVDIRSASRYGRHDLGANASRIRRFIRELQGRLDASTPGSIAAARSAAGARATNAKTPLPANSKRPLERSSESKGAKGGQAPAPRDAPRGQGQKAPPRG
jgi:uncharacterized protein (DUF1499 family)